MRIAVVGAGVSGLVAAYLLSKSHDVSLFERNDYLGGHSNTVTTGRGEEALGLDTGFVVFNEPAYPRFVALLRELGVESQPSDMSFSVTCRACGLSFSSRGVAGMLAQPLGMLRLGRPRFALDMARFFREAPREIDNANLDGVTLDAYLSLRGYGDEFRRHFIVPLAACVWSTPPGEIEAFPARYLLQFLHNHGLIGHGDWGWRTVTGGSQSYVRAIRQRLAHASTGTPVVNVRRVDSGTSVTTADGGTERFDAVVLACHADEALEVLADASMEESAALSCFDYTENRVVLHLDASFLPPRQAAQASWNYVTDDCHAEGEALGVTYHLNRLQSLPTPVDYCVSVNPVRAIDPSNVLGDFSYTHPRYTFRTLEGQRRLKALNGLDRVYFAGAHLGYGFHEDGVESAFAVAALIEAKS